MREPLLISQTVDNASPTWVPVDACTLPAVEQPVRVAEFDTLFAETLGSIEQPSPSTARFGLAGAPALAERAEDLADRETACCSFFTFTIAPTGQDEVVLEVTVPDTQTRVLTALVHRAQSARDGAAGGGTP